MPCQAGITTRPQNSRTEWLREHPALHRWQVFGPFVSREQAQAWKNLQHACVRSDGDVEPDSSEPRWWGYRFDY